jgi:E3 ubiquitin-protein ligase DOA10
MSSDENHLECRVALTRAPVGRKLIAPCGCTGSQEWVLFAELNRLRRRDPSQWLTCQTCQQKYDYSVIQSNCGIYGGLLSAVLDSKWIPRSVLGTIALLMMFILPVKETILRILTCKMLWQSVISLYTL